MTDITIRALSAFPQALERTFRTFPEAYWTWRPESWDEVPSEPFSALEQVDGISLAESRRSVDEDPDVVLAEIRRARARTLETLAGLSEAQHDRVGDFSPYGRVTVRSLVHLLASHDLQHLSGLQWLLARIASSTKSESPVSRETLQSSTSRRPPAADPLLEHPALSIV